MKMVLNERGVKKKNEMDWMELRLALPLAAACVKFLRNQIQNRMQIVSGRIFIAQEIIKINMSQNRLTR